MADEPTVEPCGSWRVLAYIEGNPSDLRWCGRVDGPCPFVGTDQSKDSDRRCATEPGTVLRVQWADELLNEAHAHLASYLRGGAPAGTVTDQDLAISRDALTACGADEAT